MVIKRELIYPFFLECIQYSSDEFWEQIFEDLAYGKSPYGTYIYKDFISCKSKKKEFSYKIEKKDPQILYNEIYSLLTKKLGLLSNREKLKNQKIFDESEDLMKENRKSWNTIRKKNVKKLLIELFISRMKTEYNIPNQKIKKLLAFIYIGMMFKIITAEDIIYFDGQIQRIEGIDFSKNSVIYTKELKFDNVGVSKFIIERNLLSDAWDKHLEKLTKSYYKGNI